MENNSIKLSYGLEIGNKNIISKKDAFNITGGIKLKKNNNKWFKIPFRSFTKTTLELIRTMFRGTTVGLTETVERIEGTENYLVKTTGHNLSPNEKVFLGINKNLINYEIAKVTTKDPLAIFDPADWHGENCDADNYLLDFANEGYIYLKDLPLSNSSESNKTTYIRIRIKGTTDENLKFQVVGLKNVGDIGAPVMEIITTEYYTDMLYGKIDLDIIIPVIQDSDTIGLYAPTNPGKFSVELLSILATGTDKDFIQYDPNLVNKEYIVTEIIDDKDFTIFVGDYDSPITMEGINAPQIQAPILRIFRGSSSNAKTSDSGIVYGASNIDKTIDNPEGEVLLNADNEINYGFQDNPIKAVQKKGTNWISIFERLNTAKGNVTIHNVYLTAKDELSDSSRKFITWDKLPNPLQLSQYDTIRTKIELVVPSSKDANSPSGFSPNFMRGLEHFISGKDMVAQGTILSRINGEGRAIFNITQNDAIVNYNVMATENQMWGILVGNISSTNLHGGLSEGNTGYLYPPQGSPAFYTTAQMTYTDTIISSIDSDGTTAKFNIIRACTPKIANPLPINTILLCGKGTENKGMILLLGFKVEEDERTGEKHINLEKDQYLKISLTFEIAI